MDAALALDIATTSALVGGIALGLAEVRRAAQARRDLAAVDIVRTVQTQEVRRAVERVLRLSDGADPAVIRADPDVLAAALAVDSACGMWGSMVFEGVVDQYLLDRMVGGWIRGTWTRLQRWVDAARAEKGNPNVGEWWQWLYERLQADPDLGKLQGAHVAYRGRRRR
ncbi:hypothetical protein BH20ACT14_BH20ACT14_13370 [soil metagenome]